MSGPSHLKGITVASCVERTLSISSLINYLTSSPDMWSIRTVSRTRTGKSAALFAMAKSIHVLS